LNGYRAALQGQVLGYHSSHPDAETALLARARREAQTIAWETEALPESAAGEYYRFIWLAGLERAGWGNTKISHKFDFHINGQRWFTFENRKDSTAQKWKIFGKDGAELSFEAQMADKFGDVFGYMFLQVPQRAFKSGAPLVLQVTGEDAESMEWYMAFQYSFNFTPRLRPEPALMKTPGGVTQALRLSLDNLHRGRAIEITTPSQETIKKPLALGANIFMLPMPAVDAEKEMPVFFKINGKLVTRSAVKIKPVTRREIYLLAHSHNDIGYTDLQPNVERKQWQNIDAALRLIHATRDYPPEARYKWNMEILWPLESYWRHAAERKREEFLAAVRDGSIGLNALYVNPLTGLANAVEMSHFTDYARRLASAHKIPITTAAVSDIPGFTWGLVPALAQSGVKYFVSAPNAGDRTGHVYEWGDKPFYWTSPSGEEKVLFWLAGASYSSFHEGGLSQLGDEKILKLVRKLDENGYPYGLVNLPYTLGDNGGPDSTLPNFVKQWNERYVSPKLILATHAQMFEAFEQRYGATLPSFKGDFTPYWEDGAASTAFETALNRQAVDRLIQGEALWAMRAPESYPAADYEAAWRNVVLYDEHTWGAHNSVSEPDLPFVKEQWKIKQRFALEADSLSRALLSKVFIAPTNAGQNEIAIDVYNTHSWPRTDLVLLSREQSSVGDLVVDEKGIRVPSQRLSTGELAVRVENLPPLSAARFFVKKGRADNRGEARASANGLENNLISLSVNSQTGTIASLRWKTSGAQLVDESTGFGLNQYLYVPGKNPDGAQRVTNVKVRIKEQGNLVASLLVEAEAPGCKRYASEIRLIDGIGRVDIANEIDKLAVREKEGVHLAFPFNIPNGQVRYDVANAVVRPETDQLIGACKNFFSVQSWVDISNAERGVTWATLDAPLVEIGAITAEQPWLKSIQLAPAIYSYVMNNYWHTNYKADQEGLVRFRYSLQPHGGFKPEEAARFGRERREPLLATMADLSKPPTPALFQLDPIEVLVASIKPIASGRAWLVYLYNPADQAQTVSLKWNETIPAMMHLSDSFEKAGEEITGRFQLEAYGSTYVRVDKK
jgi:hypothetical protein